jgi:hypothetical protein
VTPLLPRTDVDEDEDGAPPHDEKSIMVAMEDPLCEGFAVDAAPLEGSGVAQASLEPQGSAPERPENALTWVVVEADFGGPFGVEAGLDKLNAE